MLLLLLLLLLLLSQKREEDALFGGHCRFSRVLFALPQGCVQKRIGCLFCVRACGRAGVCA